MIFGFGENELGGSRYTAAQIIAALHQVETGRTVQEVARECSVSPATIYRWHAQFHTVKGSGSEREPIRLG